MEITQNVRYITYNEVSPHNIFEPILNDELEKTLNSANGK